jgi:hypothetical protein
VLNQIPLLRKSYYLILPIRRDNLQHSASDGPADFDNAYFSFFRLSIPSRYRYGVSRTPHSVTCQMQWWLLPGVYH